MSEAPVIRMARIYTDGSMNVSTESEDYQTALRLLTGSGDDEDTSLVKVEVRVVESYGAPKLKVVETDKDQSIRGVLRWFLDHPGECPGDHPHIIDAAERALS